MIDDPQLFHRIALKVTERLRRQSSGNAVLISSAQRSEGKSFISGALAETLAQQGVPPVVVDCSGTGRSAGTHGDPTWSELLEDPALHPPTHREGICKPVFIAHGTSRPGNLFRAEAVSRVLRQLSERYGIVLLDGPVLADCGVLPMRADGCILVIDAARTRREIVKGSLQANPIDSQKLLGAVLNRKPYHVPRWLYRRAF